MLTVPGGGPAGAQSLFIVIRNEPEGSPDTGQSTMTFGGAQDYFGLTSVGFQGIGPGGTPKGWKMFCDGPPDDFVDLVMVSYALFDPATQVPEARVSFDGTGYLIETYDADTGAYAFDYQVTVTITRVANPDGYTVQTFSEI